MTKCVLCQNFSFHAKYKPPSGFGKCAKQSQITPECNAYAVYISPLHEPECKFFEPAKDMPNRKKWLDNFYKEI
jgi:hypothetical protein